MRPNFKGMRIVFILAITLILLLLILLIIPGRISRMLTPGSVTLIVSPVERKVEMKEVKGIAGYTTYTNTKLGISFERPSNWIFEESEQGSIISFIGPEESKSGIGYTVLDLWVEPTKEAGGRFVTLSEYDQEVLRNMKYGETKVISLLKTTLAGHEARERIISYVTPRPLKAVKPTMIVTMDRWIVIKKDPYFYQLHFMASEEDYPKYIEAYEHAKKTFKFLE